MLSFSCCSTVSCITPRLAWRPRLLQPMWLPLLNFPPVALEPHLADRNQCIRTEVFIWFSCPNPTSQRLEDTLVAGPSHHHRHCLDAPLCPGLPPRPTRDELLSLMFPQSCFCWGLRPDPGLISDWPCQAQVCTPLATSRAPKRTTGTPCSCTRARLQSQIILEGRGQESQHPQPGFWDSLFTSPVTCANHCCFFHWYNSLPSLAPAFLSTQECRGPWPSPYPPCRLRLLLVLERSCDSDNSNNKILKDQDLTSSSPMRLGSFLHTG